MTRFYELPTFRIRLKDIPKIEKIGLGLGYSIYYNTIDTDDGSRFIDLKNRTPYLKIDIENRQFVISACTKHSTVINRLPKEYLNPEKLLEEITCLCLLDGVQLN